MQLDQNQPKIKTGQIWRNKEKNYTIKVITRIRKGEWKVSAHGRGGTTHSMTENSFHFYELVEDNCECNNIKLTEGEEMTLSEKIKKVFDEDIKPNEMFSVNDIFDLLILELESIDTPLKDLDQNHVKNAISVFIRREVEMKSIINHSMKQKNSKSRKIYQKISNSNRKYKNVDLELNIDVDEKLFIEYFNKQDIDCSFTPMQMFDDIITIIAGEKLSNDKKNIVKSRMYSFLSKYDKKGYIDRVGKRYSTLTKLKNIENGYSTEPSMFENLTTNISSTLVPPVFVQMPIEKETDTNTNNIVVEEIENPSIETIKTEHVPITNKEKSVIFETEEEKETKDKFTFLNEEYKDIQLKDLVETGISYFNTLIKDNKTLRSIGLDLLFERNQLEIVIAKRNKTINAITNVLKAVNNERLKYDKDVEFQLEENEKLKFKNIDLQNKVAQLQQKLKDAVPEETDAWKTIKLHEVVGNIN